MKATTHRPLKGICAFFQSSAFLYLFIMLMLIILSGAAAADPAQDETTLSQTKKTSVYIIPEQAGSPLQFGVAVTPDQDFSVMDYSAFSSLNCPFNDDYHGTQHADVSTVVRVALDEFDCFSGLNHWIQGVEKTVHGYSRKLKLTGELNLNKNNTEPMDFIEKVNFVAEIYKKDTAGFSRRSGFKSILNQFNIDRITWDVGMDIGSPQISFKLGIGDAIVIESTAGDDVTVGALVKLSM